MPKQQTLDDTFVEGTDRVLDHVTRALADVRSQKNDLVETERAQIGKALQRMLKTKRFRYKKNGVELLLSHTDKVRVRLVDDSDSSGADDGGEDDTD